MQNELPEVGRTYTSSVDPTFSIYVEEVSQIEADEDTEAGFCVTGCAPKDSGNPKADGIEVMDDEWHELAFKAI